ncbi:sensor histidine kinase [Flexithrix dorotheae]|uniref:sensor histidine kinase n=1 Tax=Flexithrix dorotheae TaxID=70993 RepID=UPI0003756813|nr:histidine kinase [Flexithrix dorotheae]
MSRFFREKRNVIIHIFFWIGFFILFTFFWSARHDLNEALLKSLYLTTSQIVVAYANIMFFIPVFFLKKKYLQFFVSGILVLFFTIWLSGYLEPVPTEMPPGINNRLGRSNFERRERMDSLNLGPNRFLNENNLMRKDREERRRQRYLGFARQGRMVFNGILTLAILLMSTAFKVSEVAFTKEKEATQLKNEKLQAEMRFLKSQINPHFLFNALNNAYTLSYIKSEQAPEVILKLSDILRYIIYECEADKVPLEKEITYIQNYIDLQKIRLDNVENITTEFLIDDKEIEIEPMLFIPFIENSFKHSHIEDEENGWVKITLKTGSGKIIFIVENSVPVAQFTKDKVGGIGLDNVKKRLELLYPEKYVLLVNPLKEKFIVHLEIEI